MNRELFRSFMIYGLGLGLQRSLNLLLLPLLTRQLSAAAYGRLEILLSAVSLLSLIGMLQLDSAIGRYFFEDKKTNRHRGRMSAAMGMILMSSVLVSLIPLLFSRSLSVLLFHSADFHDEVFWASCTLPLLNLSAFLSLVLRFEGKAVLFLTITLIQIATSIAAAIVWLSISDAGPKGFLGGQIVGLSIGSFLLLISLRDYLPRKTGPSWAQQIRELLAYGLPALPATLMGWANHQMARFFLLGLMNLESVGHYSSAARVASVFLMIENSFRMAWGPFFWKIFAKNPKDPVFALIFHRLLAAIVCVFFVFLLSHRWIFLWLVPAHYAAALAALPWLSAAYLLLILQSILAVGPDISKKTYLQSLIQLVAVSSQLAFTVILVPIYGMKGPAMAVFTSTCISLILALLATEHLHPLRFRLRYLAMTMLAMLVGLTLVE